MANGYIRVPPDSTGKKMHTLEHTVGADTVQVQAQHLADPLVPTQKQRVDERGAASVRFAEGSPLMDAFGGLKVSESTTVGTYDFVGDPNDDLFSDVIVGGGQIAHMPNASTMELSVTTANGDFASRTSNKYHYYYPGTGNCAILTVALSDTLHVGCERRWGIFDANNGAYFDLDDAGNMKVALRSTVSGSLVKQHILKPSWNGDPCDGTGPSGFTLDVSKLNIYWIDYQWLGAGRIRFGVVDSYGARIVCHTFLNANINLYPYMRQGSLPVQVNIENKAMTGGTASIRWTCASVVSDGIANFTYWRYKYDFSAVTPSTNTPLISLRSLATFGGGHNITNAYPEFLSVYVGGTGNVKIDLAWDYITLTGATFAGDNGSTVSADTAATATTIAADTYVPKTWYLGQGVHNINLADIFEKWDEGLVARADEATPITISVIATALDGTPTVRGTIGYAELR